MNQSKIGTSNILSACATGILLTCIFPKPGISWLAWFGLVPLLIGVRQLSFKESFLLGYLAGLVHYFTLLYWLLPFLTSFAHLPIYTAIPVHFLFSSYLALFMGVFCGFLSRFGKKPLICYIYIPFAWVALEYLRGSLLTGFPWELLGYSQTGCLPLIQISDIFGVYGVSFLIAFANASIFLIYLSIKGLRWQNRSIPKSLVVWGSSFFVLVMALSFFYGKSRIKSMDLMASLADTVNIALVQGNIDQNIKWDDDFQLSTTQKYIKLSMTAKKYKPHLIVWPETAAPFYFNYETYLTNVVLEGILELKTSFLLGSPSFIENQDSIEYYNSAYLVSPHGKITGRYDKVHLVPFGEYVPQGIPFIRKIVEEMGDFKIGTKGRIIPWEKGAIGVEICYEIIFPQLARAMVKNNALVLVNITNDAWYGRSSAPYQHFSMSIFRAVENKRSLARAANTGISGFVDPVGRVYSKTALFKDAVISRTIPLMDVETLYTRFGDWFAYVCLGFSIILIFIDILSSKEYRVSCK